MNSNVFELLLESLDGVAETAEDLLNFSRLSNIRVEGLILERILGDKGEVEHFFSRISSVIFVLLPSLLLQMSLLLLLLVTCSS